MQIFDMLVSAAAKVGDESGADGHFDQMEMKCGKKSDGEEAKKLGRYRSNGTTVANFHDD